MAGPYDVKPADGSRMMRETYLDKGGPQRSEVHRLFPIALFIGMERSALQPRDESWYRTLERPRDCRWGRKRARKFIVRSQCASTPSFRQYSQQQLQHQQLFGVIFIRLVASFFCCVGVLLSVSLLVLDGLSVSAFPLDPFGFEEFEARRALLLVVACAL